MPTNILTDMLFIWLTFEKAGPDIDQDMAIVLVKSSPKRDTITQIMQMTVIRPASD